MAEACRTRKAKVKTSDLIAELERLEVADHPLPEAHFEANTQSEASTSDLSKQSSIRDSNTESDDKCLIVTKDPQIIGAPSNKSFEDHNVPKGSSNLYPCLDTQEESLCPQEVAQPAVTASAPLSDSIKDDLSTAPLEYMLPSPLTTERLKNLYVNSTLDSLDAIELEFVKTVLTEFRTAYVPTGDKDLFQILISNYAHCSSQWQHALDRFKMVRRDTAQLKLDAWRVCRKTSEVTGKCSDGVSVAFEYAYENATLDESVIKELTETQDVMRWIIFEELPEVAYDLARLRTRISEHILSVLSTTDVYRTLAKSEPVQLLKPRNDGNHIRQIKELRWIASVLFAALRQHFSIEFHGQSIDPALARQLCEWLLLSAGAMVRFCRAEDHLFLLMHLLRLPSKLLKSLCALVQPPDPTVVWDRCGEITEFLEQPEVEIHLALFAACLRPVRSRTQFLLATNSDATDSPESVDVLYPSEPERDDHPWILVDSGGESDSEESLQAPVQKTNGAPTFSTTIRAESAIFIGPHDLDRLLRQLNLERLIQLLAVDAKSNSGLGTKQPGLMTLMAFANRMLDLIETCGDIYSQHLQAPKSRDHLGSWRILAKRLANLISVLVTAVGSRVRVVWSQEQNLPHTMSELSRVLAQYDAFCLRAAKCLLSGCGLPSTHRDAVRLVSWRYLARLFPFGLASSRSKVEFLNLIIASVWPSWKPNSIPVPNLADHVVGPLHQALLSIGLNDIGLGAIITTLGNLASVECRPVAVPAVVTDSSCPYRYHLPELEAVLVRSITTLIFGLSVYHDRHAYQSDSLGTHSNCRPLGLLPIAPGYGRQQLVKIACVHPELSLSLLFNLIVATGEQLSENLAPPENKGTRPFLGPPHFNECVGAEKLLLLLAAEAPFSYLRASSDHIDKLVDWLVNKNSDTFVHVLARTLLYRLNWESYLNPETGEPFLPLPCHMKVALGVARLVEKRILHPARFAIVQNHPVVEQILSSAKSTASSAAGLLLITLGYRQLAIAPPTTADDGARLTSRGLQLRSPRSDGSRQSALTTRRSRSQGPAGEDDLPNVPDPNLSWCVDLVIRLHLPGCAINLSDKPPSNEVKAELMDTWQRLMLLKYDRNPIAAFLVLSVHCALFGSSTQTSNCKSFQGTLRTIADSFHWKLILRALSIVFHLNCSHPAIAQSHNLTDTVSELLRPTQTGHLRITTGSRFAPLFVGACLDACLHYPHNCTQLLRALANNLLHQSDWFVRPDTLWLLDYLLRMDLWINQNYIPSKMGAQGNVLNWTESALFKALMDKFQLVYASRLSGDTSSWSEQLGVVASVAWHHSSRALSALRSRLTGYEQSPASPSDLSQLNQVPNENKSVLALFWPDLRQLGDNASGAVPPFPWWLVTVMNLVDYEIQASDSIGPGSSSPSGSWIRLASVLIKHVDEINVNLQKPLTAVESDCPMNPSLIVLFERILLEAGLLSPVEQPDGPSVAGVSASLVQRIQVILSQLAMVQTVSLLVACPPRNPVFTILLYSLMKVAFGMPNKIRGESVMRFPVGLLLLRCIPWSFCNLGCTAPETAFMLTGGSKPDDRRSVLSVLIDKLRWTMAALQGENHAENLIGGHTDVLQALRLTLELLNDLDSTSSRDARLYTNGRLLCVNYMSQKQVLDGLLFAFDWNAITSELHYCIEQWNIHRGMSVVAASEHSNLETINEPARLHARHALSGPIEVPYYPLDSLLADSISSCVPVSLNTIPKLIQDLHNSLLTQTKRLCDYVELLEELQGSYANHLVRQLYTVTNVRESKCVECRSIFPSWMIRSKRCLGGAQLTCEYQTAVIHKKMHKLCIENNAKVDEILNVLSNEVRAAACGSSDLTPNQGQWFECGLRIEAIVRHLIALSGQASASVYGSPAVASQTPVKAVGMQCFEQLCQNLSGPLLAFPVSKKLLAECIRQLADEFLTSLSAGYERVLDLMVALPHLSAVLAPTFVPPTPAPVTDGAPHPLTSLFERLMDVRVRCSAEAALAVLKKIDMDAWCQSRPGQESFLAIGSPQRYKALLAALYNSVKQTSNTGSDQTAQDNTLHELYANSLRTVLRNRLTESLAPMMELLMNDICTPRSIPLWILMQKMLLDEEEEYGKSVLSIEKLIVTLNSISACLFKPSGTSDVAQETICDEFMRCPCEFTQTVVAVCCTLLRELSGKLGCCVRERHMTCACAIPPLMDNLTNVFGRMLIISSVLAGRSELGIKKRGKYMVRLILTCISDVLTQANAACSSDDDPTWSSRLVDSFIQWLMIAHCPSVKLGPHPSDLRSIPLAVRLCTIDCESEQQAESHECWSSLSLPWSSWHPSTNALDAMIQVLQWSSGSGHSFHAEQPVASLLLYCLRHVDWSNRITYGGFYNTDLTGTMVSHDQPNWRPEEASVQPESGTVAGSLTFLCLLLVQSLHDSDSELKNQLQLTIEAIVSSSDLCEVGERCYAFILSNMSELRLPAHCVLMPPTSLEGRLFGLLASAGGMTASSGGVPDSAKLSESCNKQNLYPQLSTLPVPMSGDPRALNRKRLGYVRKVVSLLQCALLRGHVPSRDLASFKTGPLALAITQPYGGSDETRNPTLFARFLAQPMSNLFKRLLPSATNPMDGDSDDPARVVAVLGWLRVGNLLSELEAVAKPFAWADPSLVEFKDLSQLCAEVMSLIQSIHRPTMMATQTLSSAATSVPTSDEHRLNLLYSAVVAWILGAQATETGLVDPQAVPRASVMPRSIHAGLSKLICYTVLLQTTPPDQACVSAMVRVLEAAVWSVLTLAPNDMSSMERFENLNDVFTEALTQPHSEALFASNSLIYCCLREASLLPLFCVAASRAKRFRFVVTVSGDGPQILLADMLHWIITADWKSVTPNNPAKLTGLLLLLAFTVRMLRCTGNQSGCCGHHPAWKTSGESDSASKSQCATRQLVNHFVSVLADVQKTLTSWKLVSNLDTATSDHVSRLLNLVDCVGSLSESWLGTDLDQSHARFGPLSCPVRSNLEVAQNQRDRTLESIISALVARLPNFTFVEAFNYLCFHLWPDLHPCVKQILTSFQE